MDPWAQNIFRNYLATLTARVNSFTGTAYRCPESGYLWTRLIMSAGKGVIDWRILMRATVKYTLLSLTQASSLQG